MANPADVLLTSLPSQKVESEVVKVLLPAWSHNPPSDIGGREAANPAMRPHMGVIVSPVLSVLCALISAWRSWVFETGRSGCEHLPLGQGGRAAQLVGLAVDEVAFG